MRHEAIDLIEIATHIREERSRRPQVWELGAEIFERLNDLIKNRTGRALLPEEKFIEDFELPVPGQDSLNVSVYLEDDKFYSRRRRLGIRVDYADQELELCVEDSQVMDIKLVVDDPITTNRFRKFPTEAEISSYVSIIDRIWGS